MQWLHNLFKKDVGSSGYIQPNEPWPRITEHPPMPEVKPPKPEKNISEPVFAIVECMKKYPSRFKLHTERREDENELPVWIYTVRDLHTKQELEIKQSNFGYQHRGGFMDWNQYSWGWLTRDEKEFLEKSFDEMTKLKKDRMHSIQRAKMKGFYK